MVAARGPAPGLFIPANSCALPARPAQRDLRLRPSSDGTPISCDCRLEIIDTGDVLNDVVASIVPDIDAEREVGLRFHGPAPGSRSAGCYQQLGWAVNRTRTRRWNGAWSAVVESSHQKEEAPMMKIAFIAAAAVAILTTAPVITPAKAQGVDVQLGRDRDRDYDRRPNDYTVGIGPGGISVGPRQHCRTVTTRIERDDGRMITRRERRCD